MVLHSAIGGLRNSSSQIRSVVQELLFAGEKITGKEIVNSDPTEWQTFAI
jgi:hypothetical protein